LLKNRSTTPQQWEDFSRYNKERAEAEMAASTRLREAIHHTLQQTENDLEAQKIATEYAFRRRIHEFERARDELEWQKKNVSKFQNIHLYFYFYDFIDFFLLD
jgi:tektin-2